MTTADAQRPAGAPRTPTGRCSETAPTRAAAEAPPRLGRSSGCPRAAARPPADLDERDPDYIRETLPRLWLAASL